MHYGDGTKLADIADAMGKSLTAVKVQVHRARQRLRLVLGTAEGASERRGSA
jgi:DNA-directed RNA polymerase specialized sigma24 family protein